VGKLAEFLNHQQSLPKKEIKVFAAQVVPMVSNPADAMKR